MKGYRIRLQRSCTSGKTGQTTANINGIKEPSGTILNRYVKKVKKNFSTVYVALYHYKRITAG